MIGEEPKIEKPEPQEAVPTPELKEEKFDVGKYEERVDKYQEVHQELEKESQEKDLQRFEEFEEKYSSDLEPEVFEKTKEYLKKEKYEPGEEGAPEEKAEDKIARAMVHESEESKEYFKNRFSELLKEQVEKVEELKRKGEPFFGEVPAEEINYLIANKALENLADDPKMPKEKSSWLKILLRNVEIERAFVKDPSDPHREHFELSLQFALNTLISGLKPIFPEDVIKQFESIRNEKMRIRKAEKEQGEAEEAKEAKEAEEKNA